LSVRLAGVRLLRRPLAAGGIGTAPGFREGMIQARNMPKVVGGSFAWAWVAISNARKLGARWRLAIWLTLIAGSVDDHSWADPADFGRCSESAAIWGRPVVTPTTA